MGKHILVTGGTGFIGTGLCAELLARGHRVTVLSRDPESVPMKCGSQARGIGGLDDIANETGIDAIVNLAGAPIAASRWSKRRKELLLASRVDMTRELVELIARLDTRPECLVSGSAVGFYGDQADAEVIEETKPHEEFSHELCRQWEQAAKPVEELGVRLCVVRTGLVLGNGGGFLQQMLMPFRLGLGGRMGEGKQWMPWIHMEDMVRLLVWMIDTSACKGAYNATAPVPVTNARFAAVLAAALGRPAMLPLPAPVLRVMFGEMSQLLLTGQNALPRRALDEGFHFHYRELPGALADVLA